jgi:hypothetical protein
LKSGVGRRLRVPPLSRTTACPLGLLEGAYSLEAWPGFVIPTEVI